MNTGPLLAGRVALITGGASGIGAAIADRFAAQGARVVIADVKAESGGLTELAPGRFAIHCDVAEEASIERTVAETLKALARVDVLVNSAGIAVDTPLVDTPRDVFERIFTVNVTGLFQMSRAVARHMVQRGSGSIVQIASISGLLGSKGRVAYGGSKGAVINMMRVMATELGRHGVRVNAIAPGPIDTPMTKAVHSAADRQAYLVRIPLNRYGTPEDIANAALYLASDLSAYVTGQVLAVDGGFTSAGLMPLTP